MKKKVPYTDYLTFFERVLCNKIKENRTRQALPQFWRLELKSHLVVKKNSRNNLNFPQ
jgi:hypothetical protein